MKQYCLWIMGMPNAGKSTLTYHLLQKELRNCIVIDGDRFREHITPELSFSRKDIIKNNLAAINMINYLMSSGFNVVVAMITPFQEIRDMAREKIDGYIEVWAKCPESVRSKRPNFMKSQIKFETPKNPDVIVLTDKENIHNCVNKILKVIKDKR